MKQFKKRTLALILASVVTVVGAFGADNYKNSLMGLKFDSAQDSSVDVTLFTKLRYDNEVKLIRKDANTYVIMLPETNSQMSSNISMGAGISSVDVKTMPFTTQSNGYTKVTIKTTDNISLIAKTAIFVEDKTVSVPQIETNQPPIVSPQVPMPISQPQTVRVKHSVENTIHSKTGVDQISPVDIRDSVKQFQQPVQQNNAVNNYGNEIQNNDQIQYSEKDYEDQNKQSPEWLSWFLGIALTISLIVFFFVKAKGRMGDIIGEDFDYTIDDSKKEKNKKEKINKTIKNLDKKYSKPVKMPIAPDYSQEYYEPETAESIVGDVVDLDELLNAQNKTFDNVYEIPSNTDEADDENLALEEFLSAYSFGGDDDNEEIISDEKGFDEELYEKFINNEKMKFTTSDIHNINLLMRSEITDEAMKLAPKVLKSTKKEEKVSPRKILENFVTMYTVHQNITFTKEDIAALNKLINVEIDDSFVTDLRTNPQRMIEMQDEISRRKTTPHKTSEILTLNVKDMLPDLSLALKEQGNKKIESNAKPQVVYYSEGYEVSTLKVDDELLDLSKEIMNSGNNYQEAAREDFQIVDLSYDVEKMHIVDELPDLSDVLKNPEKYEEYEDNIVEIDEDKMLENLNNASFKPFDDGTRMYEVINKDIKEAVVNTQADVQSEEIILSNENKQNEESQKPVEIKPQKEIETPKVNQAVKENKMKVSRNLIAKQKLTHMSLKRKSSKSSYPEFCLLDGGRYNIIDCTEFTEESGCYLAEKNGSYCVIGYSPDKTQIIKTYDDLNSTKIQSRISEKLEDGTYRYIVRLGANKFILNVKGYDMEFVMDLC